jgi:hypothetical protein
LQLHLLCSRELIFFSPKILFLDTRQKDGPASPREVWNDITRCGYMPIFPLQHWEQ